MAASLCSINTRRGPDDPYLRNTHTMKLRKRLGILVASASLLVLTAHTYMAFANPAPENRKRTMMITGIASLLALVHKLSRRKYECVGRVHRDRVNSSAPGYVADGFSRRRRRPSHKESTYFSIDNPLAISQK